MEGGSGRPRSGVLYHERRNCKRNAQQYLNKISGTVERRIQKRDNMFCEKLPCQFWSSTVSKIIPDKILVNNNFITDLGCVLSTWAEHFESLSQSQITASAPLSEIQKRIQDMERCSFNEVTPFWCSFDNLSPEHFRFCGSVCTNWLCKVYNSICWVIQNDTHSIQQKDF